MDRVPTLRDWAQIFEAGMRAIPSKTEPAANALALALEAMQMKAVQLYGTYEPDRREPS